MVFNFAGGLFFAAAFGVAVILTGMPAAHASNSVCVETSNTAAGRELLAEHQLDAAYEFFATAYGCSGSGEALKYQAQALLEMGRSKEAISLLEKIERIEILDAEARFLHGIAALDTVKKVGILKKSKYVKKARAMLESAIAMDPGLDRARFSLASFYMRAPGFVGGDKEKARQLIAPLEESNPGLFLRFTARAHQEGERHDSAVAVFQASLAVAPEEATYIEFIHYLHELNRASETFAVLEAARRTAGSGPCLDFVHGESSDLFDRDIENGISALRRFNASGLRYCVRKDWAADGYWRLGHLLARQNNIEEARRSYQQALEIDNDHSAARRALARLDR